MDFQVLVDETFINACGDSGFYPVENKSVLSIINDFEDGEWRYSKFQNFIWDNIAETALSSSERSCLVGQHHSLLTAAAKNLRLTDSEGDIGKGSELAEIVLYGIMKHHFGALPVVPKIFYKQNSQDNAKGADGVHVLVSDDDFSLWFGEAKFYTSIENSRLRSIVDSVRNSLDTDKLKKENSIITNILDLKELISDPELRELIVGALSHKVSIDVIKKKINIPIFILHECKITQGCNSLSDEYRSSIVSFHKERAAAYFKRQVEVMGEDYGYGDVRFHIILFPVPEKDNIVRKFLSNVEHYKGQ